MLEQCRIFSSETLVYLETTMKEKHRRIVFLRTYLSCNDEDQYLVNMALALDKCNHNVTILTTSFDKSNALEPIHPIHGNLDVQLTGSWIPQAVFGKCESTLLKMKALWLALSILLFEKTTDPDIVVLDTDPIALLLISNFSRCKTIYIQRFSTQKNISSIYNLKSISNFLVNKAIDLADKVIVQSKSSQKAFKRLHPAIYNNTTVLFPYYNIERQNELVPSIRNFIPDLPQDYILFTFFADIKKKNNCTFIFQALDYLYMIKNCLPMDNIRIVIFGYSNQNSDKDTKYYDTLVKGAQHKFFNSRVTFLKNGSLSYNKALVHASTVVIYLFTEGENPAHILYAMSIGKPIIALKNGIIMDIFQHKVSAILIIRDAYKLVKMMELLILKPFIRAFLSFMARESFNEGYSFTSFSKTVNEVIAKSNKTTYIYLTGPSKK